MAEAILTANRLRELVDYNPETGVFTRKIRTAQRHQIGDRADFVVTTGTMSGYHRISIDSNRYQAHRAAWLHVHGVWPKGDIDHINGDKGDNRIANLRDVDRMTNQENIRAPRKHGRSGMLGASWEKSLGKWRARVRYAGKVYSFGCFDTPEAAHEAYLEAKRKLHKGCTI